MPHPFVLNLIPTSANDELATVAGVAPIPKNRILATPLMHRRPKSRLCSYDGAVYPLPKLCKPQDFLNVESKP